MLHRYKCGALSYLKIPLLWGMSLVLFQTLSTPSTRYVELPLPFLMQTVRVVWSRESLSNILDSNFHWRGLIFWYCLLPWFLLLASVFFTCCTLSWALGRLTAVSLCVHTSVMLRVCWHNSNNFRVLAEVVYSKAFAITTQNSVNV